MTMNARMQHTPKSGLLTPQSKPTAAVNEQTVAEWEEGMPPLPKMMFSGSERLTTRQMMHLMS